MATLFPTIVPALAKKDGGHTIRIAVRHNNETRYIPTKISIDSISEFKNGKIVKRADKEMLNIQLRKELILYEERYDSILYNECLSCSQLVKMLKESSSRSEHQTIEQVTNEFLEQIDKEERPKTYKLYRLSLNKYIEFAGKGSLLVHITPIRINSYITALTKSKLSPTTINIYLTHLKVLINYAVKMRYVSFEVDPFITARIPSSKKRDTAITIEELKRIRDYEPKNHNMMVVRDIFMLTYYLAGINLIDMLDIDFKDAKEISYIRRKTMHSKDGDNVTCFTIPDEAFPLIKKYMDKKTGKLVFGRYSSYVSCYNVLARKIKDLQKVGGIRHYFTLYSARKSFVQHGFDIGIPLSTLEYCIGQTMKEDRPIFNYVRIMKKHADLAIRQILDNLK